MRVVAIVTALLLVLAPVAPAQTVDDMAVAPPADGESSIDRPRSRRIAHGNHWVRCLGFGETDERGAILSCSRIIGERISRVHTATAYYNRGRNHRTLGETAEADSDLSTALRMFSDAIGADPRNPYGYINRATLYEYMERYDDALADYARAIEVDDEIGHPNYRRGAIFFKLGDYARAIAEYDEASRKAPEQPYYQAARCEGRAAAALDLDVASAACAEAIRIAEEDAYVYFSRGFLRFRQGDLEGALADFDAAADRNNELSPAIYGRGVAAIRLGRPDAGAADIARAVEIDDNVDDFYGNAGLRP